MRTGFCIYFFVYLVCVLELENEATAAASVQIHQPNGGADATVFTNKVVLWGEAAADVTLKTLQWTNYTAGVGGTGTFEWIQGGTSGWWRTTAITLTAGMQSFGAWAVATNNSVSATDTISITYDSGGFPPTLGGYTTGAVFATSLQIDGQWPPVTLSDSTPKFTWSFGDALNATIQTNMSRVNMGAAGTYNSRAVVIADLTGDGRPDLVVGNYDQQTYVLINDGGSPSNWPRVTLGDRFAAWTYSVAVGDLNGDGRPDVAMGNRYGVRSYVLLNNGGSPDTWTRMGLGNDTTYPTDVLAIGDLTGDGRPDVVLGNEYATSYVLVNNGGSPDTWLRYPLTVSAPGISTFCVAIGDVTGDGLPDVVMGNNGQQSYVAVNNGGLPNTWSAINLPTSASSDYTMAVALADLNGDGWMDIAMGNSGQNYVLMNNRTAPATWTKYNLGTPGLSDSTYSLAIADLTGDGRPDVLVGNSDSKYLIANNGGLPNTWTRYTLPGAASESTCGVAIGDLSGDGRPDVAVANYSRQSYVLLNTAAVMPFTQAGYEVHVARNTNDLDAGAWVWSSGVTNLSVVGDGFSSVQQANACTNAGDYYWHLRLFSTSGYQGDWTAPQRYTIPTNRLFLFVIEPVPPRAYITNTPYGVKGWVSWNATTSLAWTNLATGSGGPVAKTGMWTQTVALATGTNDVRFVASAADGSSFTQSIQMVYLTDAPRMDITAPNGGLSHTTTAFTAQMAGLLTSPSDAWGTTIYWSNSANGVVGALDRANGQMLWPAAGTATVPLQRGTDNTIRVWCNSALGGAQEDRITIGCYDTQAPTLEVLEPNGGLDTTVYTNAVVLYGRAADNGTLATLVWSNVTAGTSGTGVFEWVQSGTSGWWRTPPVPLAPGPQQLAVWVLDSWGIPSTVESLTVTYSTGGLPADLTAYPTGAVFVTGLQVNRACPPATISDIYPRFCWLPGDALNTGSPTNMLRVNLGRPFTNATQSVAIGDLTGDGRPDVVVGNLLEQNYVMVNDGGSPSNWPRVTLGNLLDDYTYGVAISDMTGDGRADVIVRNYSQNYLLINTGTSPDTWPRLPLGDVNYETTCSLGVGDLTGDGRPDVVIGCNSYQTYALLNTGSPSNWIPVNLPVTSGDSIWGVAVGDVSGDGRADIVTISQYQQNLVLVNNGGSPTNWPRVPLGTPASINGRCAAIGDVTGDGRPDVVVGNYQEANYVLVNDGGSPSNWPRVNLSSGPAYQTTALAIGDVNGDGRPDVTVGINGQQSYVAVNNGGSPDSWPRVALGSALTPSTTSIALGDVTGDGRPDVVMANANGQNCVLLNTPITETYGQAGYRLQVARTSGALESGPLLWDSTAIRSPDLGDGCSSVRQLAACTDGGDYYWRVKLFSASGYQSEWSDPQRYTIPTNQLYLTIERPAPPSTFVTNTPCAVAGWASWNATNLVWTNMTLGSGGTITTPGAWTQAVALAASTNRVRFTARAAGGLAATQSLDIVYLAGAPHIDITSPNSGLSYTTTYFSVQLAGSLSQPLDSWGMAVYWSNRATGVMGTIARTNGQSLWPASGAATVALQPWTDNVIRVWSDSLFGSLEDTITVGCYDDELPSVEIVQPNGGADAVVYTNKLVLAGAARDNGTLVSVGWTNLTTHAGGVAQIEWIEGGTNAWWRTPVLNLSTGTQQFAVWAVDTWNHTSVVDTIAVSYSTNGVPENLTDFTTGAVFATSLQADRQWPPVTLNDINPDFSWIFGDAVNAGSPTGMASVTVSSSSGYMPNALAIGDMTGDGRPDIVIAYSGTQNVVLVNNGSNFTNWLQVALGSPMKTMTYGMAIGDVTGDGRPDVVLGNASTQNLVVVNNGGSPETWERVNLGSALQDDTRAVAIADVTGDGRPDIVVGNYNQQNYVLVNNGSSPATWPRLNLASGTPYYPIWGMTVGDVTGDGRPDVVLGNIAQQNIVLVNNGISPTNWSRVALGTTLNNDTRSVSLADFNGDGRLDVAVGNSAPEQNYVLLNNGGSPNTWTRTNLGSALADTTAIVVAGDLTGDGRPDVFVGNYNEPTYVLVNNGGSPSTWARISPTQSAPANTQVAAIGDLNGDGRPDIACDNGQHLAFVNTTRSMPAAQAGYRAQVARSPEELAAGVLLWDSGIATSPDMGDGLSLVRQAAACTNAGVYYWRVKTFSTSGCQSDWNAPRKYVIPTNQVLLSIFRPVPPRGYVTASPCSVTGWMSWNATNLFWTNSTAGVGGRVTTPGFWTQTVALVANTNALTFVASAAGGLSITSSMEVIYLTNAPRLEITAPNGGQALTTAFPSVQMAGFVAPSTMNWWAYNVFWSNAATRATGYMPRANGQSQWPTTDTQIVTLQRNTDNVIRVWCDTLLGEPAQDTITVGSYDTEIPTLQILQPNGGAAATVYTNKVVLMGVAGDNGPLIRIVWSNLTTGVGGLAQVDRNEGDTNLWWRTPVLPLATGSQEFRVWAVDSWNLTSAVAAISVTCNTNGIPAVLADFTPGAVFATGLEVNRQAAVPTIGDPNPKFSWRFGDALNTGTPSNTVRIALSSLTSFSAYGLAWGDVTGDGRPDAVAGINGSPSYVAVNDGGSPSAWPKGTLGSSATYATWGVVLGDVTGDGRPDAILANYNQQNYATVNNGSSPSNWPRYYLGSALNDASYSVALGDFTGDGRLDAVIGNRLGQNYVLVNNGANPSNWPRYNLGSALNDNTYGVAVGDLNGDGRPDVVVANYNESSYVLVNNGASPTNWSRYTLGKPAISLYTYGVAVGDLNGDGRLDVVLGGYGSQQSYMLFNNGGTPDTWTRLPLGGTAGDYIYGCGMAIGDVTGDGRPDVVLGEYGSPNYVVVNTGADPTNWPRYRLGTELWDSTLSMAIGDANGDGRVDVLVGNSGTSYVMLNTVTSMPCSQVGYQVQVARTPDDLAAANLYWDSGIVTSPNMGDGLGSIQQTEACVSGGSYYWRVTTFSSSGYQSPWTAPCRFEFIAALDAPFIDITNSNAIVTSNVTEYVLGGTNNANVVGVMWWTNRLTGNSSTFVAVSPWTISGIPLGLGTNIIRVFGSNNIGSVASDSVSITRGGGGDTDGDGIPDTWELQFFSSLTNVNSDSDWDCDGFKDAHECFAGTDPTDPNSLLKIVACSNAPMTGASGLVIRWSSETNKYYRLNRSTNLLMPFDIFKTNIFASPPINTETDATAIGKGPYFYRVRIDP